MQIKKTIRLNSDNPIEDRIIAHLSILQEKKEGAFIKEALTLYIDLIEANLYKSPYYIYSSENEDDLESKFAGIIETLERAQITGGRKIKVENLNCEDLIINVNEDYDILNASLPEFDN